MKQFIASSVYADSILFNAVDYTEARHWVINHLDLSKNWTVLAV